MTDLAWRKSSRSTNTGGQCVEVALDLGTGEAGSVSCGHRTAFRDSKHPAGGILSIDSTEFSALLANIKEAR